jgi:hypothetical protein
MREFTRLTGDGIEANTAATTSMALASGVALVQPAAADTTAVVPAASTSEPVRTAEAKQSGRTAHTAGLADRPTEAGKRRKLAHSRPPRRGLGDTSELAELT